MQTESLRSDAPLTHCEDFSWGNHNTAKNTAAATSRADGEEEFQRIRCWGQQRM